MPKKKRKSKRVKNSTNQVVDIETLRSERRDKRKAIIEEKASKGTSKELPSERKVVKNKKRRLIYVAICVVIFSAVLFSSLNILNLKAQEQEAAESKQALIEQREKLQDELSRVNSPEYIEQQARESLRMIKPGEILYILREASASGGAESD